MQHGKAVSGAPDKAIEVLAKQHRARHPEARQMIGACRLLARGG
jgi:hypothetical protein